MRLKQCDEKCYYIKISMYFLIVLCENCVYYICHHIISKNVWEENNCKYPCEVIGERTVIWFNWCTLGDKELLKEKSLLKEIYYI